MTTRNKDAATRSKAVGGVGTKSTRSSDRQSKGSAATTPSNASSTASSPTDARAGGSDPPAASSGENLPPASPLENARCSMCGAGGLPEDLMSCRCCASAFHARCANLPQTPEEGEFFCRWECFTAFRKRQDVLPKTPLGDFSRLAARVQSILGELPRRPHRTTVDTAGRDDIDNNTRAVGDGKLALQPTHGRSRSASPYLPDDRLDVTTGPPRRGGRTGNGYQDHRAEEHARQRRPSPSNPAPPRRSFSPHVDLTRDSPPRRESPRSRSARGPTRALSDLAFDEQRHKRPKHVSAESAGVGSDNQRTPLLHTETHSPSARSWLGNGSGSFPPDEFTRQQSNGAATLDGVAHRPDFVPLTAIFDHRNPQGRAPPAGSVSIPMLPPVARQPSFDDRNSRPNSARSRPGSARYDERAGRTFHQVNGTNEYVEISSAETLDPILKPEQGFHAPSEARGIGGKPLLPPTLKANVPWLNPAAFPVGLTDRFNCKPDNVNGVFRIDLTPVFADKTMHLYQSEIDFFFRCFESADVSLVVKGMASELNQYIWAWPFILESCGSEAHFTFDHFQFRHKPGEHPELDYVGELRLSMAAYNAYLERYLSGSSGKEVVVLEDHVTKKPITLVAAENIIALNQLVIADHCTQLYNDLIKSFQWDVFAGGIHCLLQYLPQTSRHKRFSSPLLHFNFPGARGSLRDPGNGTTDQAYQVLVGSLELVIFERLEPKDRDEFYRVLCRAGYESDKKAMLLDSHLRYLRDTGFAWSTVLLNEGEFVHVNKGRLHFWRVVEPEGARGPVIAPCVFLSWEWVYQGVSQRGISTECWFAMKNASLCSGGWAFDPRRAIVEAAKCGVAIVRTGQFLNSLAAPGAPPVLLQLAFSGSPSTVDRDMVSQRQEQMVLFLESILPCMDAIVEEEFELGLVKDDSEDFRKIFDDELMWKVVDTALSRHTANELEGYRCGICQLELTNIYKQCLGCTVHSRRSRPNMDYKIFRICLRCHAQPEHHHFKPRAIHGYYEKLCSSEGHTGLLPATRRYQSERSYFKCRCTPYVRCTYCGGCESCCCLCHTLFQTRFRFTAPEHLDHLRTDVVDVIKWHKQQQQQQLPPPPQQR